MIGRRWRQVAAGLGATSVALLSIMIAQASAPPVQRDVAVTLSGLPRSTKRLRVVLLSDFHTARIGDTPQRLAETVRRVSALRPDVILLAGDFVAAGMPGPFTVQRTVAPLRGLSATLGVFAVLGNHDYLDARPAEVISALQKNGIQVLDNSVVRAGPLTIIGVSDAFSGHARLRVALAAAAQARGVPVLFTHSPDVMANLPPTMELALAGHTHCGQIVLPVIGPIELRTRYGRRFACGIVREGARTNIISAGLGVSRVPFRLGAPPDFWVITVSPRSDEVSRVK